MVRVGIVQAGTIIYNTKATLDKLKILTTEAAEKGAQLVLFPEAFVGGYPKGLDFGVRLGTRSNEGRDEFRSYFDSAIVYDGVESNIIAEVARSNNVYIVVGVVERDGCTLYCSVFFYGPDGRRLGKHRKLMPTALERVVWGFGDGSTLPVLDTLVGKVGAVICWENYMPLLRTTMYNRGIQLYMAPTVDDRDAWQSTMRTIALEGRCFVLSACQFLRSSAFPEGHPAHGDGDKVLIRGGSCAFSPLGESLLEPDFQGEKVAVVECDLDEVIRGKFDLDVVGHYSRPDIFQLFVNEKEQKPVTIE
ncbi:carbon-nitrogen hydrolase domain-containing protein [Ditylenchus destructor]|nr:carbon-nitrogen hydrolase domain-containing protein [Ditylenchus destructor]